MILYLYSQGSKFDEILTFFKSSQFLFQREERQLGSLLFLGILKHDLSHGIQYSEPLYQFEDSVVELGGAQGGGGSILVGR